MDYLLEIGTEEIPARFLEPALEQLKELGTKMLEENRIDYDRVESFATPRRLVLYIRGISSVQADLVEEVKGPSRKAAFDEAGNPTKAAEGFARSQGIQVSELLVKATPNGEYIFAVKRMAGRLTSEVLSRELPQLITGLSFPRPMRWGNKDLKFARPIRWILSLFGEEVVDFELDGLRPGRLTYGLRFYGESPISISKPCEYFEKLRQAYVIVDQEERRKMIWDMAKSLAGEVGGYVRSNEDLLEEITYLVEYPTPVCGSFPERFLRLPPEVVITPMQEHQRYFPVWSDQGKLLPKFITFANGPVSNLELVREGNEKVLRARLKDAEFFYEDDLKTPLEAKVDKLKTIVFLEGLGTMYDKAERLVRLSRYLGDVLRLTQEQRSSAERAAYLAKADLVTSMVYEFPELQGIMGGWYALASGEKKEVCQAIREHYQPRFAGDEVPASQEGAVVALADKIDNLVGCFAVGLEPTGSQDPYALRRQALGICHITLVHNFDFSLGELIEQAYSSYNADLKIGLKGVKDRLDEFFRVRLKNFFLDQGFSYDAVEAALAAGRDRILVVKMRLEALEDVRKRPEFDALLTAYTRAANLARHAGDSDINPALFEVGAERELYNSWIRLKMQLEELLKKRDFRKALLAGAGLVDAIDRFFSEVMVMVEDEALRNNRLALLKDISSTMGRMGDLSKIVK